MPISPLVELGDIRYGAACNRSLFVRGALCSTLWSRIGCFTAGTQGGSTLLPASTSTVACKPQRRVEDHSLAPAIKSEINTPEVKAVETYWHRICHRRGRPRRSSVRWREFVFVEVDVNQHWEQVLVFLNFHQGVAKRIHGLLEKERRHAPFGRRWRHCAGGVRTIWLSAIERGRSGWIVPSGRFQLEVSGSLQSLRKPPAEGIARKLWRRIRPKWYQRREQCRTRRVQQLPETAWRVAANPLNDIDHERIDRYDVAECG